MGEGDFSIEISANLVNRLANGGETLKKKPRKTKPKGQLEPPRPQAKLPDKQHHDESEMMKGTPPPGWSAQPPLFVPINTPVQPANNEVEAIRAVLQDTERVLDKLQKQEDNMAKEVTARAKDLRDKEFKLPYQKPMPCMADYKALQACYKEHTNDILKCALLTKSYHDCVHRAKQQASLTEN